MPEKTEKNLAFAFSAESKAAARNKTFALKASKEGYPQIAHLFRAVSEAESVHARRYLFLMRGKIGSTKDNLKASFENEIRAQTEEYPRLIKDAEADGAKGALKAFNQALTVEKKHAELYKKVIHNMDAGSMSEYYVCQVCGNISEEKIPERCPVCGAVPGKFKHISK